MQRKKVLALAAMLMLVIGASFSTQAQKNVALHVMPPVPSIEILSGTYTSSLGGSEINGGEQNPVSNQMYGWTLQATAEGDLSGFVFLSVNYDCPDFGDPADSSGVVSVPAAVTGGSWSKLIFVDGVYQGSVSGSIVSGSAIRDSGGQMVELELRLAADGATGIYSGNVGVGTFKGTIDRRSGPAPIVSGTMDLTY